MSDKTPPPIRILAALCGIAAGVIAVLLLVPGALAAPPRQEENPPVVNSQDCRECHLDIAEEWSQSPHAHAFDNADFQERWSALGQPGECLACHTTNYVASTGEYTAEGVECEACHGTTTADHPPEIVPVKADTEYCGECHTSTLGEWRATAHAQAEVGCMDCHNPHSQGSLFESTDDLCLNCHKEETEKFLEDLHIQKGIGCVDCHALVIPPDPLPDDGIVPTGHAFAITTETCVACHTDTLHAGTPLPGYEQGAAAAEVNATESGELLTAKTLTEQQMAALQRLQALEAALASRNLATLFQGGVVGLVFGGTTAWMVARNLRRYPNGNGENNGEEAEDEEKETQD